MLDFIKKLVNRRDPNKPKVYCQDCKYLGYEGTTEEFQAHIKTGFNLNIIGKKFVCESPNNSGFFFAWDTWYTQVNPKDGLYPYEQNRHNDCPWFEQR